MVQGLGADDRGVLHQRDTYFRVPSGRLKLREAKGVLIRSVMTGEPADQGGIKADDVIVTIDGTPLETPRDLQRVVSSTPVGTRVRVGLLREGRQTEVEVTIGLYKERSTR